jgi:hypothetical protein
VSVHDVEVHEACAAVFDGLEAVTEFEEVSVQHAGGDNLFEHTPKLAKSKARRITKPEIHFFKPKINIIKPEIRIVSPQNAFILHLATKLIFY